ncbi:alpha/beta hydrolase [Gallaecimonas kandeliae]|uniref:alpha/beta fold hydrolase n=1 Tax=Gallaecimonas kandeliae TaxID=3029055 RepID=UPI0026470C5F|nr:alpha/beta hydrolase [Gallaecimonas kandeliae]WKE66983.1 alpha/beta hydrolase [Gallaecimonas kandeliae]
MPSPNLHVRSVGAGPAVICLHCNASSSGQWRALAEELAADHRVLAPDLYGAGKSAGWPGQHQLSLSDEVAFISPLLGTEPGPLALVGHSYGGAVALVAGLRYPKRIKAMVLFEPTLFSLVDAQSPPPNRADGIRSAVASATAALDRGDPDEAARYFIDFWSGEGCWAATPDERKAAMAKAIANIRHWQSALFGEPAGLAAFASLQMPILYLQGGRSPKSAQAVAEVLIPVLPNVRVLRFPELGHMAPVTHPQVVNAAIADFLRESWALP